MKHYHFIGIGGIGMSALARILLARGHTVSGSDIKPSTLTRAIEQLGGQIFLGHDRIRMGRPDVVVYSSSIPTINDEYAHALETNIPLIHRSELLAQMMEGFAPLLVAGSHGKTTTTSLLVHLLIEAGLDPTCAIGGVVKGINANARAGKGIYFAAEADESDGTFLNYPSFGAIITNLEREHMCYWENEKALENAFSKFADQVGSSEHLFWCCDDPRLLELKLPGKSYGFSEKADLSIDNFRQEAWKTIFDLSFEGKHYSEVELPLIGGHNVLNAASVFGLGVKLSIPEEVIRQAFMSFQGIGRRLEHKGEVGGVSIYDDYAHHPTEIFATLRALHMAQRGRRIIAVFQPHRYTRVRDCMSDFPEAFEHADHTVVTDIYAAGEPVIEGISGASISKKLTNSSYASRKGLVSHLKGLMKPGDIMVTMGAGDITEVGPELIKTVKTHDDKKNTAK